jgi:alpha-beta hydrolase superfamily lysophospholipase
MIKLIKPLLTILTVLAALYLLMCLFLYAMQEKLIFFPTKLDREHVFRFSEAFEEHYIPTEDGLQLHGLLFKASRPDQPASNSRQKLVFFLHGNAGALDSWGTLAPYYTRLGYDTFLLDYRGYGKSRGNITSESQFLSDVQTAYAHMASLYSEEDIVIVGFSIGSGPAAMLAARNRPAKLLLLAPYYSLTDMVRRTFPFVPPFLLKYKFRTWQYLDQTKAPAYLFHGNRDEVVPYASSQKLKTHLKPQDQYITLEGVGHNSIHESRQFQSALQRVLAPVN